MNKIFAAILVSTSAVAFTACVAEQEDIFDKTATERLDEIKGVYAQRLASDGGKWVMEYYPTNEKEDPIGLGYLMACNFTSDFKVVVGMNNEITKNFYKESTSAWEILTDNGPVLSFNTYNDVLHTFSTPENIPMKEGEKEDKEDETGRGYEGDYEFVITNLAADSDYAMLKGKKRGTYNRLTRLPADTDLRTYISEVESFRKECFPLGSNDLRFVYADKLYYVKDMGTNLPNIYPSDGDVVVDKDLRSYLITKHGDKFYLRFRDAFGEGEEAEQEFVYDPATYQFVGIKNEKNVLRGISDEELPYYLHSDGGTKMGFGLTEITSASDKFSKMIADVVGGFPIYNKSYTLNSVRLSVENGGKELNLVFNYKVNRSSKTVIFEAPFTPNEKGIEISEWRPDSDAKKLYEGIDAVKTLVDALQGAFDLQVVGSNLNISEMRFDKLSDGDLWFSSICK